MIQISNPYAGAIRYIQVETVPGPASARANLTPAMAPDPLRVAPELFHVLLCEAQSMCSRILKVWHEAIHFELQPEALR